MPSELRTDSLALAEPVEGACGQAFRERTKAELLEDLRISLEEALAGDLRPALEVLDGLDRDAGDHANTG